MDIRYFYVGDHIQNKTVSLHHCPTEEMLAEYFTKPLQGSLFVRLWNFIMGAEFEDGNPQTQRSVLGCDDAHATMDASEQNQAASDITTDASEHNQVASEREQHEITPAPARDQNNEFVCANCTAGPKAPGCVWCAICEVHRGIRITRIHAMRSTTTTRIIKRYTERVKSVGKNTTHK